MALRVEHRQANPSSFSVLVFKNECSDPWCVSVVCRGKAGHVRRETA